MTRRRSDLSLTCGCSYRGSESAEGRRPGRPGSSGRRRFELIVLHQLLGQCDAVDFLSACVQLGHAEEDPPVLLQAEVLGLQRGRNLHEEGVVEQDGPENITFCIDVGRQTRSREKSIVAIGTVPA